MYPAFNLNYDEKIKIMEWKRSLPENNDRKFSYIFIENDQYSDDGYKLYNHIIKTDDNFSLNVAENVELC